MARLVSPSAQALRDPSFRQNDIDAVQAIAQAAVDVELFTIPLYMTSLYSIRGTHEINDQYALYKGWTWPGAAPVAPSPLFPPKALEPNQEAFNILFSIFIEEMLHLQMAANMATAVGVAPSFTSPSMQTGNHAWKCYGPAAHIIPHIIDLYDTKLYDPQTKTLAVPVDIGPLDKTRLQLFLAIEQPDADARAMINPDAEGKYFEPAPFKNWNKTLPLPMFGTIGHMYQCYFDYLHIQYSDGTSLWDSVFDPKAVQNDHFNRSPALPQYQFKLALDLTDSKSAFADMCNMMDAITDQGEGSVLEKPPAPAEGAVMAVMEEYRAIEPNLEKIYVSYNNRGEKVSSTDAFARCSNDGDDHYERFARLDAMLGEIVTWDKADKVGQWTAQDFTAPGGPWDNPHKLPDQQDLADAWNAIPSEQNIFEKMSQACIGSIAGTTTVLEAYWKNPAVGFPGPAMGGTGNRMSTIWAALGRAPDLSLGLDPVQPNQLGHSCQALDYTVAADGELNSCAQVATFHSCIGSNNCHAEGGCGFVNKVSGGGSCGSGGGCSVSKGLAGGAGGGRGGICGSPGGGGAGKGSCGAAPANAPASSGGGGCGSSGGCGAPSEPAQEGGGGTVGGTCGPPQLYSGPGDNACKQLGGCAVPISASQLYPPPPNGQPTAGMEVFDFVPDPNGVNGYTSKKVGVITYQMGDKVDEVAYLAFKTVMASRSPEVKVPDEMPSPTALRLVYPPST
jgi:hypothetical protein